MVSFSFFFGGHLGVKRRERKEVDGVANRIRSVVSH